MKIIIRGRQQGKTYDLIKYSDISRAVIICATRDQAKCVSTMAKILGCVIPEPMSVQDYLNEKAQGRYVEEIVIDDADEVLARIFCNTRVSAITMTPRD